MLPREYRLQKNSDFRQIYQKGRSLANAHLVLYFKIRTKPGAGVKPRIGFSVSRKIGSAVQRNRVKRNLRAALKPYLTLIPLDFDLIFIARPKIKGIPFSDVERSMENLLKRAGLLKKDRDFS